MSGTLIGAGATVGIVFIIILIINAVSLGEADTVLESIRGSQCNVTAAPTTEQFYCPEFDDDCYINSFPVSYSISNNSGAYIRTICDDGPFDTLAEASGFTGLYIVGNTYQCYFDEQVPYVCYWQYPSDLRTEPLTWVIISLIVIGVCCVVPVVVGIVLFAI
eukprot:TRINITY_DN2591_c0_g1_i2.p1 TRINITY_DN2591_c0_g1~~TRINITY_DN2591_c0_g1_i2.p1  ORF type:complete len:172 (-),score=27.58 TRINITY_DN2591_c0_g1_i2:54-539(-)